MFPKKIDKTNKTGLTKEKKKILKSMSGSVLGPDLNTMRHCLKYGCDMKKSD
jgi:hypothetical protein